MANALVTGGDLSMVYLNIYSQDFQSSVDFYVNKLCLFEKLGDRRLVCKLGNELIIDLREKDAESKNDFGIRFDDLEILDTLKSNNVPYKLEKNLAGAHLYIEDPDNNTIWITTESGEIS